VNITEDRANCGACGNACALTQACVSGACTAIAQGAPPVAVNGALTNCATNNSFQGRKAAVTADSDLAVAMICNGVAAVAVSSSGGASYSAPVSLPFAGVNEVAIEGGPGHTLYAAAEAGGSLGFAVSTTAGATWSAVTTLGASGGFGPSVAHFGNVIYVQDPAGTLYTNKTAGVGAFTTTSTGNPATPMDVLTDVSGDVWSVGDDGTLYLTESINQGASFGTLTSNSADTDFYTDWSLGGTNIFEVGDEDRPGALTLFPIANVAAPTVVNGLPTDPTIESRAMSADADGNACVVDELTSNGSIVLSRLASGAAVFTTLRTLATTGTAPGVKALPGNQALVVYTSGTSVYATVQQY
jgi:hypothetical protein